MMNMFKKRKIAYIIDFIFIVSLLGIITVFFKFIELPHWLFTIKIETPASINLPSIGTVLILLMIFAKDLLFINASLGKKIMKIRIVDVEGGRVSVFRLIKRSVLMQTVGIFKFFQAKSNKIHTDDFMRELDEWEKTKFGTKVI